MKTIKTIVCCCGHGLGSSMMVQMNIERYLKQINREDIVVSHTSLSEANPYKGDLYVIGRDIAHQMRHYPHVIVLKDLIATDELESKLSQALSSKDDTYFLK